mmetsp:Transcript_126195/g.252079  ORF Transcript_126195/g.252079 Transcript_126195/m.252079 type:complete len:85 (-) Transcript_126195:54-308(-)
MNTPKMTDVGHWTNIEQHREAMRCADGRLAMSIKMSRPMSKTPASLLTQDLSACSINKRNQPRCMHKAHTWEMATTGHFRLNSR